MRPSLVVAVLQQDRVTQDQTFQLTTVLFQELGIVWVLLFNMFNVPGAASRLVPPPAIRLLDYL